ncbi:MAG: radical SAM family heme chaperone HemW [Alphaproteobacteria bacterium]
MIPFGIYLHWPFCRSKCPYCDFASFPARKIDFPAWEKAYVRSLEAYAVRTEGKTVSTIFFGGGTPSLMPPELTAALLAAIRRLWPVDSGVEISMEANPGTLDALKMGGFAAAGINRLSIGVQALNDTDLKFLGRLHDTETALEALRNARNIFAEVSADFIYARPNQTLESWKQELERILELNLSHLSLYQLTLEEGTFFHKKGLELPEEELAADLFETTDRMTYQAGLPRYEVSNHARKGHICRHNLMYWQGGEWLGIGPAAHGRFTQDGTTYATVQERQPSEWLKSRAAREEILTLQERAEELILMGFRTDEGILRDRFREITGRAPEDFMHPGTLADYQADGLLIRDTKGLRLTARGLLILNALIPALLA